MTDLVKIWCPECNRAVATVGIIDGEPSVLERGAEAHAPLYPTVEKWQFICWGKHRRRVTNQSGQARDLVLEVDGADLARSYETARSGRPGSIVATFAYARRRG